MEAFPARLLLRGLAFACLLAAFTLPLSAAEDVFSTSDCPGACSGNFNSNGCQSTCDACLNLIGYSCGVGEKPFFAVTNDSDGICECLKIWWVNFIIAVTVITFAIFVITAIVCCVRRARQRKMLQAEVSQFTAQVPAAQPLANQAQPPMYGAQPVGGNLKGVAAAV